MTSTKPPASETRRALMSTDEVMATFGRTARTLWNWRKRGFIQPVRVGKSLFYRRADIQRLAGSAE